MEINISDERYEEIKRAIVETFARYNVTCVPVNGFELATKMGIKVKPYSAYPPRIQAIMRKKSEDGFCAENEFGEWCICYNDSTHIFAPATQQFRSLNMMCFSTGSTGSGVPFTMGLLSCRIFTDNGFTEFAVLLHRIFQSVETFPKPKMSIGNFARALLPFG